MAPPPPTEAELPVLPVEMLTEILLRVSTPADLVHAAATSKSWRRAAVSDPTFLARYRERQPSSTFLGIYVPRQFAGPPSFYMPDSIRLGDDDARDLKHAARRAFDFGETRRYQDHRLHGDAFIPGRLGVHPDCRLLDCHNSRLLLTRGDEALEVRIPLARESIVLPFPPDVIDPYSLQACLLHGHDKAAASSFRVVYLQHRRLGRNQQVRAVEYDSRRKSWQDHPWETIKSNIEGTPGEVMHAGHRIFCKFTGLTSAALVLNTNNMHFSVLPLPSYQNFAIGEIEDDVCCFVEADGCANHRLKVWQLDEKTLHWDPKKNIEMNQVIGVHAGYYRPRLVSNGLALLCSRTRQHHFVVDLKTFSMKEEFEFYGQSAYPIQMPWPLVFSDRTANSAGRFDRDGGPASVGEVQISDEVQIATSSCREASAASPAAASTFKQPIIDVSITSAPSLSDPSAGESAEQRGEAAQQDSNEPQDLDIQDPTTTAPTSATAEQCFGKDKNYVQNNYLIPEICDHFSDLMNHKGGFDRDVGPASVGDARTGSGDSDMIEDLFCGTLAMAPPAAAAVEPEEPLVWRSQSPFCVQNLDSDLLLQPPALASCPLQGRKRADSRETKGSPEAKGPGRRNWNQKPKYLEAIFALRRHQSFSIASKISDEVQIAASSCREASAASTAAVSTFKFTDVGKQPIIDVGITSAPSLSDPGESAEQRGEAAQDSNEPQGLDIQDPTATAPTAIAEQCFGKDKNCIPNDYLIPDICDQFSDLVNPTAAGGFDRDAGPASVGDARTGSGESDTIEELFGSTLAMPPPAAPAVEPEELLVWRNRSPFCAQSLDNDLLLQPPALACCPQQGRKRANSRESEGSPEDKGPGRRNWKKPKYVEDIFSLRRHRSFSIAPKISDEVQIATSCREASATSTAVVGSTIKFTDPGKQPITDVSITSAPSSEAENNQSLAEQSGGAARGSMGRSRREKMPNPKYIGGDWVVFDEPKIYRRRLDCVR